MFHTDNGLAPSLVIIRGPQDPAPLLLCPALFIAALPIYHWRLLDINTSVTRNVFEKKHIAVYFCQTGLYIFIIIINTKLLHHLKSINHKHFC